MNSIHKNVFEPRGNFEFFFYQAITKPKYSIIDATYFICILLYFPKIILAKLQYPLR